MFCLKLLLTNYEFVKSCFIKDYLWIAKIISVASISGITVPYIIEYLRGLNFESVLRIRIGFNEDPNLAFYLNANPDPGSQTNANPDPGQTSIDYCVWTLYQYWGSALVSSRIRIQILISMRIQIQGAKPMRIQVDPDPLRTGPYKS